MSDKHYKAYIQIGLNVLRYRKERGLTQMQLAEMIGYSRNQISRLETAYSEPRVSLLMDISQALDVPLADLLEIR